jgi:hypothetical protein
MDKTGFAKDIICSLKVLNNHLVASIITGDTTTNGRFGNK